MINQTNYEEIANRIKLLAHPERLRILDLLRQEPQCVCHLEAWLGKPQPYISQQLRLLREAGIIRDEKDGLNVFYRLVDAEIIAWLELILGVPMERITPIIICPCPKCEITKFLIDK